MEVLGHNVRENFNVFLKQPEAICPVLKILCITYHNQFEAELN